jgi:hypothetical protein
VKRIWLGASSALAAATLLLFVACEDAETTNATQSGGDAGGKTDGETRDASSPEDASADDAPSDAGADAREAKDANGPGEAGAECSFNRDCNAALRCECSEAAGCGCAPGARGTGKSGIDTCDGGNQCASAVCVEGPGGVYYCSDECDTSKECTGALPVCASIAFVGRICIRDGGS